MGRRAFSGRYLGGGEVAPGRDGLRRHSHRREAGVADSLVAKHRLLIVDDEPAITRLIEVAAIRLGLKVLAIHDTDQFEKAMQTFEPTIILLDIAMPGRDGLELIGHLAARNYPGQVVVMSGADPMYVQMSSAITKTRGLRLAGTLLKPFRAKQLTQLLSELASHAVE